MWFEWRDCFGWSRAAVNEALLFIKKHFDLSDELQSHRKKLLQQCDSNRTIKLLQQCDSSYTAKLMPCGPSQYSNPTFRKLGESWNSNYLFIETNWLGCDAPTLGEVCLIGRTDWNKLWMHCTQLVLHRNTRSMSNSSLGNSGAVAFNWLDSSTHKVYLWSG